LKKCEKQKLWNVSRKLKNFTLDDILIISGINEEKVIIYLELFVRNKLLMKNNGNFVVTEDKLVILPESDDEEYFLSPEWAKKQANKYLTVIKYARGLKGKELRAFIKEWNENNPEFKTSYQSVQIARRTLYKEGRMGLLAKYGKSKGKTSVKDEYFEMFKELYLTVLKPSMKTCAKEVKEHFGIKNNEFFPSPISFLRRLKREMTQREIDYARN
jgi:predicted transposase YbfD/YdcC